jgi:acyl carrier protein
MSQRDDIRKTLVDLIENDVGQKFEDLSDAKNLREELGLDSVDVVSIVSQIERQFRIRLSQQELEKLVTVGNLLDLLQEKLSAPPAPPATQAA